MSEQLHVVETGLNDLADMLDDGDLVEAHKASASLLLAAEDYNKFVTDSLETARSQLRCCQRYYVTRGNDGAGRSWLRLAMVLVAGAAIAALVARRATHGKQRLDIEPEVVVKRHAVYSAAATEAMMGYRQQRFRHRRY